MLILGLFLLALVAVLVGLQGYRLGHRKGRAFGVEWAEHETMRF